MKKYASKMVEVQEFVGRHCDLCDAQVPPAWECATLFVPRPEDDSEIQVDICDSCFEKILSGGGFTVEQALKLKIARVVEKVETGS